MSNGLSSTLLPRSGLCSCSLYRPWEGRDFVLGRENLDFEDSDLSMQLSMLCICICSAVCTAGIYVMVFFFFFFIDPSYMRGTYGRSFPPIQKTLHHFPDRQRTRQPWALNSKQVNEPREAFLFLDDKILEPFACVHGPTAFQLGSDPTVV